MQVFNAIALKMVMVSKLARRKLIPHRSIIGLGAFRKIKSVLEIFPDSYCAYSDWTINSKTCFCCLAYSQYKSHS